MYSLDCKKWKNGTVTTWYARYGSATVNVNNIIYSIGGFNGGMLNDLVQYFF